MNAACALFARHAALQADICRENAETLRIATAVNPREQAQHIKAQRGANLEPLRRSIDAHNVRLREMMPYGCCAGLCIPGDSLLYWK